MDRRLCNSPRRSAAVAAALYDAALSPRAAAQDEQRPNCVSVQLGPQLGVEEYRTHLKLAASYARWIAGRFAFDLAASVLATKHTDLSLGLGARWRFASTRYGLQAYARWGLEAAQLFRDAHRVALAGRASVVTSYYSFSKKVALSAEFGVVLGPAFGGATGAGFAAALDILAGVEIPF